VTNDVEGANNCTISGTFVATVFEGPYNAIPNYVKKIEEYLKDIGKEARDYLVHYVYCPTCAEKYGYNYSILFAKV